MRWPWQSVPVEHRSSYTDQVVTAILAAASGGGVRPALTTAAVETCSARCTPAALSSMRGVSGPASRHAGIDRRLARERWRAELVRRGQVRLHHRGRSVSDGLDVARVAVQF